jgi:uncharacterized protein (TIGR00725 family)
MAVIGVMGSGQADWATWAQPLGVWIGEQGHHLLTGGGQGVMRSVAEAFCSVRARHGRSVGILPSRPDADRGFVALAGYPNPYVEIPIVTPLPRKEPDAPDDALTRNHANVLSSDVVIALPGGRGTLDEIRLCLLFGKPLLCFGPIEAFDMLPAGIAVAASLDEVAAWVDARLAAA